MKSYSKKYFKCQFCGSSLLGIKYKKYCSSSCAAKRNNKIYPKRFRYQDKSSICLTCKKIFTYNRNYEQKFCSSKCFGKFFLIKAEKQFNEGKLKSMRSIYNILDKKQSKCQICGIRTWNGKKLRLDVDHKNGDSLDHKPSNLRLLCPNCHSQTPTWKGKNIGKGSLNYSKGRKKYYKPSSKTP